MRIRNPVSNFLCSLIRIRICTLNTDKQTRLTFKIFLDTSESSADEVDPDNAPPVVLRRRRFIPRKDRLDRDLGSSQNPDNYDLEPPLTRKPEK